MFETVLSETVFGPFQVAIDRIRSLGTTPISEKSALVVTRAILGAHGEFRGILGAALGMRNSILGIPNSILGMASHDLSNTKNHNSRSSSRSDYRN